MGLSTNNPITLTVVSSGVSFSRSFSIKVTQIECNSLAKGKVSIKIRIDRLDRAFLSTASDGCLQYFTGVSGQMFSFNYNDGSGLQLSNTDYSICVRMDRNFCGIQYTACPDTGTTFKKSHIEYNLLLFFSILVNTPAMSFSITGGTPADGSKVGTTCATDWITIPCATNTNDPFTQTGTPAVCVDRICGMVFNSATTASGSPSVPVSSKL